jgi:hypothetical protein
VTTVLILSLLVRSFEFSAVPRPGETPEAMRVRLLRASTTVSRGSVEGVLSERRLTALSVARAWQLTLTPKDLDLRLRKR